MPKADDGLSLIRRLIGDLADQPDVYRPVMTITDSFQDFPGKEILASMRGSRMPEVGSEVGLVNPHQLIIKSQYPKDLQGYAGRRPDGDIQIPWDEGRIPVILRPTDTVNKPGFSGQHVYRWQRMLGEPASIKDRMIDIGAGGDDALRTLIHEARHATETLPHLSTKAMSSVANALRPAPGETTLAPVSRRYYAKPSEVLAYLGGAGDDFVQSTGRLIENARDVNNVMERVEAGESLQELHPLVRDLYVDAYKNNKTARSRINNILTRYLAVPAAAAAYEDESP